MPIYSNIYKCCNGWEHGSMAVEKGDCRIEMKKVEIIIERDIL